MERNGLKQCELAPKLGIEPSTLNNFLKGQSSALGGLAVALACTFVELECGGLRIGRLKTSTRVKSEALPPKEQLVIEFNEAFKFQRESERSVVILRRPPGRQQTLRLSIKRIS